jgi:predicted HicB family RNase H-like nuclease
MTKRRRRHKEAFPTEAEAPDLKLVAQFVVSVPGELALRLRRFCQETRQSFNQTVAEALEQYLKRKRPPGRSRV